MSAPAPSAGKRSPFGSKPYIIAFLFDFGFIVVYIWGKNMSMKTPVRTGDRVWVKDAVSGELYSGVITDMGIDWVYIFADNAPFTREIETFNEDWGNLADNEFVIGGQLIKPQYAGRDWLIDIYSITTKSILDNGVAFTKCADHFKMSDADKAAIQEHVRKHSAPQKRTAKDAKIGDEVWLSGYVGQIKTSVTHVYANSVEIGDAERLDLDQFGTDWGFWEDRHDVQEAKPNDTAQALPIAEPEAQPSFNNVKLLIKTKGTEWVKTNAPDAWRAYVAAQMQEVRQEGDKLAKPGILAGKTASPWG